MVERTGTARRTESVPGCAAILGISTTNAWKLVHEGAIKSVRLGGRVLVAHAEIERILAGAPNDGESPLAA